MSTRTLEKPRIPNKIDSGLTKKNKTKPAVKIVEKGSTADAVVAGIDIFSFHPVRDLFFFSLLLPRGEIFYTSPTNYMVIHTVKDPPFERSAGLPSYAVHICPVQ